MSMKLPERDKPLLHYIIETRELMRAHNGEYPNRIKLSLSHWVQLSAELGLPEEPVMEILGMKVEVKFKL